MEPDEFFKMRNRARKEIYEEFSPRHEALEKELAALKEKYRWHDAREEKPTEKCRYILATIKDKVIVVGVSINHMEDTVQIQDYEKPIVFETKDGWAHGWNQVVRWMPLPDLPKEANP